MNQESISKKYTIKSLSEYQTLMERFENYNDPHILPDLRLVVRLDARRTGDYWDTLPSGFYPYATAFHEALLGTAVQLMRESIQVQMAFVHGDEISLVLDPCENINPRRRSRLVSLLASAASLHAFQESSMPLLFHTRLSELPTNNHLLDYFLWQRKVAARNFISCQLAAFFEKNNLSKQDIDQKIGRLTVEDRFKLAKNEGVEIDSFTTWQLRGAVVIWEHDNNSEKKLIIERDLPIDDIQYCKFLEDKCFAANATSISIKAQSKANVSTKGPFKVSPRKR